MADEGTGARSEPVVARGSLAESARRLASRFHRRATAWVLDLLVFKPIAIFVWWFSQCANELRFPGRAELRECIDGALAEGRPVLVASNHVSWFDDPVVPMALYRSGERATLELGALGAWVALLWWLPTDVLPIPLRIAAGCAAAAAIALFGVRKFWWTLGDLVNLRDATVLEGKLALTRKAPPGRLLRVLLEVAHRAIPWFMRTDTTKTVFVDRRPGEEAKRARARALTAGIERAERLEPVWVFFEGGRSKVPGVIAPARRGVGALALGLRSRGFSPLVVVIQHRGMERLIPPGGSRFLSCGHSVDVGWSVLEVDPASAAAADEQAFADAVRQAAVRMQDLGRARSDA
jgi:1-acyl-sn-glycerol-3-phosphate acyltransferase